MRVTHVITRLIVGGAQENTLATVLGLRDRPGMDVRLISGPTIGPEGSLESVAARVPGLLVQVPALVRPVSPANDVRAGLQLLRLFRQQRPDLVHTHSGKAGILGRWAAQRAGVPLIVHTIHGPSFGPFQGTLANFVFRAAERWAARRTTHFIAVAEAMIRQYLDAGIGRPEQFTRIVSGFDLTPFQAALNSPELRARWGLRPGDFVVGTIARLFALKGHDDLLEVAPALAQGLPQLKFLWVGDGSWRPRLETRVQQLGLTGRVVFTGLVPPDAVPSLIGIMDMVVHLSRREGLPRALPQALAAGRPVVAYDCDGAREVCRDGETGFLLEPGDRSGLAQRLAQLAGDAALCARLGDAGRRLVSAEFQLTRMIDAIESLYHRLELAREPGSVSS